MPRLSIVIPCLSDGGPFEDTLASVLQNRPEGSEILVVHAQPYADPYALSGEVKFVLAAGAKSETELLNKACAIAKGEILHVLHPGLDVEEGWTDAALAQFEDPQVATVVPVIVDAARPNVIVSAGVTFGRSGHCGLAGAGGRYASSSPLPTTFIGPNLQAGFYRTSLLNLLPWDERASDEFAAVDLALSYRAMGFSTVLDPSCLLLCDRASQTDHTFGYGHACRAERLFRRHIASGSKLLHAGWILLETLAALPSPRAITGLLGRLSGLFAGDAASHATKLASVRDLYDRVAAAKPQTFSFEQAQQRRPKPVDNSAGRRKAA